MQTQTIENDLSAPASPAPANDNGGAPAQPRHHPRSTESFVDAAMEVLGTVEKPKNRRTREQVPGDAEAPEADEQGDAGEHGAVVETETEEEAEKQADAEPEGAQEEEHDLRGSKDEPFTVKDLPKDKFIELKVDGERVVVTLEEMGAGYIRERTFNRWANKTKSLASEAEAMINKARETDRRMRTELTEFLKNPQEIVDFYMQDDAREQVLFEAARRYAEIRKYYRERPEERLAFQRRRDQERLAFEREQWQKQKEAEQAERAKAERAELIRRTFVPGFEAGLRKAGFPKVTDALRDEVLIRCQQKQARGEDVTSEDVTEFVVRAAKILDLPKQNGQKRPVPAPSSPRPEAPRRANGKDPWAGKSQRERVRDPEYFLRNLRSRDFR